MEQNQAIALVPVQAALTEFEKVSAGLADLSARYKNVVYPVATTKGMDEAKAARLAIREPRYAVQRAAKAAKDELNAIKTNVSERADQICQVLMQIEEPIDAQIKVEEQRKEEERQARIKAEQDRVAELRSRIEKISAIPVGVAGKSSSDIALAIIDLEAVSIDDSFQEFQPHAQEAKATALEQMRKLHDAALEREQEAERLAAERAEIERVKAQQAAQAAELERLMQEQRQAAARAAAEAALAAQKALDEANAKARREAAEREAFMAKQRELFEAEKAAAQALLDQQRREIEAEQARIAAEANAKRQAEEAEEAKRKAKAAEEKAAQELAARNARRDAEIAHAESVVSAVAAALNLSETEAEDAIVRAAVTISAYKQIPEAA